MRAWSSSGEMVGYFTFSSNVEGIPLSASSKANDKPTLPPPMIRMVCEVRGFLGIIFLFLKFIPLFYAKIIIKVENLNIQTGVFDL